MAFIDFYWFFVQSILLLLNIKFHFCLVFGIWIINSEVVFNYLVWLHYQQQQVWLAECDQISYYLFILCQKFNSKLYFIIITKYNISATYWAYGNNTLFTLRLHKWLYPRTNWQKWKSTFLTCPCHEIYRGEAVGLKSSNYTWKVMIFVNMWNLGQFR